MILGYLVLFALSGCAFVVRLPAFKVQKSAESQALFRGAFHVHSEFSHDSEASLDRIIRTAKRANLDFVVVTDHNTVAGAKAYKRMNAPERPLLIFASEISTDAGHVIALGVDQEPPDLWNAEKAIEWILNHGGYPILAHPVSPKKPWTKPGVHDVAGLEIFSFPNVYYTQDIKELVPKAVFLLPKYFINSVIENPKDALALWDKQLGSNHLSAFGSVDAHLRWEWGGFAPENYLLYLQSVTTYIFAKVLNEKNIVDALARGNGFLAHETRGIAQGFSFLAKTQDRTAGPGETLAANGEIKFEVTVPNWAEIRLLQDGRIVGQTKSAKLNYTSAEKGVWRVEVYRERKLWIASNPIYVE